MSKKVGEVWMRLIDADALADALFEKRRNYPQWVADTIGNMPDAVVRCKNCKHIEISPSGLMKCNNIFRTPNWYCADGVKKGETE